MAFDDFRPLPGIREIKMAAGRTASLSDPVDVWQMFMEGLTLEQVVYLKSTGATGLDEKQLETLDPDLSLSDPHDLFKIFVVGITPEQVEYMKSLGAQTVRVDWDDEDR